MKFSLRSLVSLEPISPISASVFKAVRLSALRESPTAFGSTYEQESQLSDAEWSNRASACTRDGFVGYLAMEAGIGCGIARATPDNQDSAVAWLESMWVAPSHRRDGIGRLLVNKILAWARSRGMRTVKLSVTSSNEPAICFYKRLGFCLTGRTEPYPNDPALLELEMLLPLA